jgi:hypothetical protein
MQQQQQQRRRSGKLKEGVETGWKELSLPPKTNGAYNGCHHVGV